jgi:hypothetical protein
VLLFLGFLHWLIFFFFLFLGACWMLWLCAGVQDKHVWRPGENPDDAQVSTSFVATVKVNDSKKPADPQQYISACSTSSRLLFDATASSLFAPCASHEATPNFSVYRDLLPPTSPASVYTIGYMYIYRIQQSVF